MAVTDPRNLLAAVVLAAISLSAAPSVITRKSADAGLAVELTLRHTVLSEADAPFREGDEVAVMVKITDAQSGAPMRGLFPTAWMSLQQPNDIEEQDKRCVRKVATFSAGNVFRRPEVDLNVYHVVMLNADASLSVVDPHFSFGGTQLLAMLPLASPGEDWAFFDEQRLLAVSMPDAGKVAIVDTLSWRVVRELDAGVSPRRVLVQPDEELVWVSTDAGVTAIRRDGVTIAARIATGKGPHDLAASSDNRFVFVTNAGAGTTSVIDVRTLRIAGDIGSGSNPVSVAWSPLAGVAAVAGTDGTVTFIDPRAHTSKALKTADGITRIRFAPGGRLGFIPNPKRNTVEILDTTTNRIVQTADIAQRPFEVTFTNQLAYVRSLDSEIVIMMPLAELGTVGKPVSVLDFTAGQRSFGKWTRPTPADGVIVAPGENAVLVANPGDRSVYYYREGMAAPTGTFSNSGKEPRAILVFDRTLHETAPGAYTTTTRLGRPGPYDFALLVDSPRIVTCLSVAVQENPVLEAKRRPPLLVEPLTQTRLVRVGEKVSVRYRLLDAQTKQPRNDLRDVLAVISLAPGTWQERHVLTPMGDGEYVFEFRSPEAGTYHVYIECPSVGLRFNNPFVMTIEAQGP
jgi:YVTN family beta-propeller protein